MTESKDTSRRSFLDKVLTGGIVAVLAAIFYPVSRFIIPPESGEAKVNQVKLPFTRTEIEEDPKKAKTFKFGRSLGIIVLTPTGELHALSATCTHLDCTVQNRPDLGIIWCACHNGRYDYNGKNISGPPPRPLEQYSVKEDGDDIFVARETA
jgi:Rieske Fe-S protein